MSFVNILMIALMVSAVPPAHGWMVEPGKTFQEFTCPTGQVLYSVDSEHNDLKEDRGWNYFCKNLQEGVSLGTCSWSSYQNSYDATFDFTCSSNNVLAGIKSVFSNSANDRRFQFYCCPLNGGSTSSCAQTGYINSYDEDLRYTVGCNDVIVGMKSRHSNWHEDRQFDFHYCALS